MNINEKIKERLNAALVLRGLSPAELAAKSGLQKSSVSRYLSGQNVPRSLALGKMASALDVSPAWLLGYNLTIDGKEKPSVNIELLTDANQALLLAYYQALLDAQGGDAHGDASLE